MDPASALDGEADALRVSVLWTALWCGWRSFSKSLLTDFLDCWQPPRAYAPTHSSRSTGGNRCPVLVLLQTSCVWIKRSFFLLTTMHQADLNPCASLNPKMHLTTGPLVSRSLLKAEPWLLNHQSDFWWFPTGNNILGQCLGEWNNPEF